MNGDTINQLLLNDYSTNIVTLNGNRGDYWYQYRASLPAGHHKVNISEFPTFPMDLLFLTLYNSTRLITS